MVVADRDLSWLREEIALGLSKCVVLRLAGTPPEDAILHVAEIWFNAILDAPIYWTEDLDRIRIRRAFIALTRTCNAWPTPKMLLDNLPPRPFVQCLDEPPMSEEKRAENLKKIRNLIDKLNSNLEIVDQKRCRNAP